MNNNSNNCGDCGTTCSECGRPWAICKQDGGCGCNKCKDIKFCEYGRMANGCIREKQPGCPMQAVIPSVTVESIEGIKNLADCLVHVSDINTTFYIDDKHRPIITWAGPIDIPGYDMEGNPNNYRDQIVTDVANQIAVIYDKSGNGYTFGLAENLDVQDEINNKLDEMAADGTLANIMDEYLYSLAARSQESAIALSFYIEGGNLTNFINYTNDGVNWKQVKIDNFTGRDPSLVYDKKRKCFYLTVTPVSNQTHSFKIYKTTDFVTFEEKSLLIGTYYAEDIMAPDLYLDETNDKLIVNFSYKTGNTVTDCDGQSIPEYWLYRVDLSLDDDITNITPATTPQALVLTGATSTCMIDSNIIYHNNLYYMNCKDDINKIVQVYQSADGINYNLICPNVLNNSNATDNTLYIEGGSWFKFNNEFYLICDSYYNLHKLIVGKTKDFVTFYDWSETNMNRMRHAGAISVDSDELKVQMLTLPNFGYNTNGKLPYYGKPSDISRQFKDGFNGEIIAVPNMLYVFLGDATITNIKNPFHCESINFMFACAPNKTIVINKIQNITKNRVLRNSFENNEKLIKIEMSSAVNSYPYAGYQNFTEYDKNFIEDYFTAGSGWSIVDGYAYRQGNIMSLMVTIRPSATASGSGVILLQKNANVQGVFIPKKKVIMSNEAPSVMSSVTLFPVSGNITANLTSAPVRDYTIFATYIVN